MRCCADSEGECKWSIRRQKIDDEAARRDDDERDRQRDPHGVAPARQADEDEPRAWPSSDRQKSEATSRRVEQGDGEPSGEPDIRAPSETGRDVRTAEGHSDLPVPGYPNSEEAVTSWFVLHHLRRGGECA